MMVLPQWSSKLQRFDSFYGGAYSIIFLTAGDSLKWTTVSVAFSPLYLVYRHQATGCDRDQHQSQEKTRRSNLAKPRETKSVGGRRGETNLSWNPITLLSCWTVFLLHSCWHIIPSRSKARGWQGYVVQKNKSRILWLLQFLFLGRSLKVYLYMEVAVVTRQPKRHELWPPPAAVILAVLLFAPGERPIESTERSNIMFHRNTLQESCYASLKIVSYVAPRKHAISILLWQETCPAKPWPDHNIERMTAVQ